ncbi:MAG: ATP-binding cassette domain-containing protein [Chlamydiia bacterium]
MSSHGHEWLGMYLNAQGLGIQRSGDWIFRGVDFELRRGDRWILTGASGKGKSTLLRCLAGLLEPTEGRVVRSAPMQFGWMAQADLLLPWRTVWDNACLGMELGDLPSLKSEVERVLDRLGLLRYGGYFPTQLSQGMRQRVALARTLLRKAPFLLLDEPCSALDMGLRHQVLDLIIEFQERDQFGLVMVTHHDEDATCIQARTVCLAEGSLREVSCCGVG